MSFALEEHGGAIPPSVSLWLSRYGLSARGLHEIDWDHLSEDELLRHDALITASLREYEAILATLRAKREACRSLFSAVAADTESICFLIDVSGSMYRTLSFVQSELIRTLNALPEHARFNCIAFSGDVVPWSSAAVRASPEMLQSACAWVSALTPQSTTNTLAALQRALMDPTTTSLCLLSDGLPDSGPSAILRVLPDMLALRTTRIHTISCNCDDPMAIDFLRRLASLTEGSFTLFTATDIAASSEAFSPAHLEAEELLRQECGKALAVKSRCLDVLHTRMATREEEDRHRALTEALNGLRMLVRGVDGRWFAGVIESHAHDDVYRVRLDGYGDAIEQHVSSLKTFAGSSIPQVGDYVLAERGDAYYPAIIVNMDLDGAVDICRVQFHDEQLGSVAMTKVVGISFDEYSQDAELLKAAAAAGGVTQAVASERGSGAAAAAATKKTRKPVGPSRFSLAPQEQREEEARREFHELAVTREMDRKALHEDKRRELRMQRDAEAFHRSHAPAQRRSKIDAMKREAHQQRVQQSALRVETLEKDIAETIRTVRREKDAIAKAAEERSQRGEQRTTLKHESMRQREVERRQAHAALEETAAEKEAARIAALRTSTLQRRAELEQQREAALQAEREEAARRQLMAEEKKKAEAARKDEARQEWQGRRDAKAAVAEAHRAFEKERVDHAQREEQIRATQKAAQLRLREEEAVRRKQDEEEQKKAVTTTRHLKTVERTLREKAREIEAAGRETTKYDVRREVVIQREERAKTVSGSALEQEQLRLQTQRRARVAHVLGAAGRNDEAFKREEERILHRRQLAEQRQAAHAQRQEEAERRQQAALQAGQARHRHQDSGLLAHSRGQQQHEERAHAVGQEKTARAAVGLLFCPY